MSAREMFGELLDNLKLDAKTAQRISFHYRKITKHLNIDIRGNDSRIANRLKVGSVGRHTAIKGISDLDMLYIMPDSHYEYYNGRQNGQSELLTYVRNILAEVYPEQVVKKDRLVVQVKFRHFVIEVQPVFRRHDGSFVFPDSYRGGSWRTTNPVKEMKAMTSFSREKSNNLRKLCKMARAWKNKNGVNMGGLLIDTLAYRYLSSTAAYDTVGNGTLGFIARDFFLFLSREQKKGQYRALGSLQDVKVYTPWFGRAATEAYTMCCEAIDAGGSAGENDKWRKVFGRAFPRRKADALNSRVAVESMASDSASWDDTEEFIEDSYPVDIRHHVELDCTVTQAGFRTQSLRNMLQSRYRLSPRKKLYFKIDMQHMSVEQPYSILWKVLNVGDEARRRNLVRGQILPDEGKGQREESTDFRGDHIVECYVIKDEVVVGRAEIAVPIE